MKSLRLTEEQYRSLIEGKGDRHKPAPPQKKRKYRNEIVATEDGTFDSKREAARYGELKLLEKGGLITGIARQVRFFLGDGGTYIADFVYWDLEARRCVVEDCKGFRTPEYIRKRGLMAKKLGIAILES